MRLRHLRVFHTIDWVRVVAALAEGGREGGEAYLLRLLHLRVFHAIEEIGIIKALAKLQTSHKQESAGERKARGRREGRKGLFFSSFFALAYLLQLLHFGIFDAVDEVGVIAALPEFHLDVHELGKEATHTGFVVQEGMVPR